MTATHFILSTICIGLANSISEWFFLGFAFHRYQAITPQTWRTESSRSYIYSTLLSLLFGALFTIFYYKIGAHYVIRDNAWSHVKLGIICFGCFNFVAAINSSVYVNYDRKFVVGLLTSSFVSYIAASLIASIFSWK